MPLIYSSTLTSILFAFLLLLLRRGRPFYSINSRLHWSARVWNLHSLEAKYTAARCSLISVKISST